MYGRGQRGKQVKRTVHKEAAVRKNKNRDKKIMCDVIFSDALIYKFLFS